MEKEIKDQTDDFKKRRMDILRQQILEYNEDF
jgi:hypothetical protein